MLESCGRSAYSVYQELVGDTEETEMGPLTTVKKDIKKAPYD